MYGGLTISKGKYGSFLSFVGNINNECTNFYGICKKIADKNASISDKVLFQMFVDWAKQYFKKNDRRIPDIIMLYREGFN